MDKSDMVLVAGIIGLILVVGGLVGLVGYSFYEGAIVHTLQFCDTLTSVGSSSWGATTVYFSHGQIVQIQNLPSVVIIGHPYDVVANGNGVLTMHAVSRCSP